MRFNTLLTFFLCSSLVFTTAVYAFSFGDIGSWLSNVLRITGYASYTNETTTTEVTTTSLLPCPYECCQPGQPYQARACEYPKSCIDGKCIDITATTVQTTTTIFQNETTTTALLPCPYECCPKDPGYEIKECLYPKTCAQNKCIETTTTQAIPCSDSDGGKVYDVRGTARDPWGEKTDYCQDDKELTEYWCGPGTRGQVIWITGSVPCDYGCRDGACLPMPTPVCGNGVCESDEKTNCPQDCSSQIRCYQNSDCGQTTSTKYCGPKNMPPDKPYQYGSYACKSGGCECKNLGTYDSGCECLIESCVQCASGCMDGECIGVTTTTVTTCSDSDNGDYYEKGTMKAGGSDTGHTDLCGDSKTLTEYYCENNEARKTAFNCPNGCNDGACLKGEAVSEQITCRFKNSDREQQCVIAGGFSSVDEGTKFCKGKENCVINYKGFKGEKVTWKSSCGGYQYTIQDGNNEVIEFDCKSGETTQNAIKNKGFRFAYWQCYDGSDSRSEDATSCKTSETWQKYASIFCNGKCTTVGQGKCEGNERCEQKCGVNSFSVWNECYWEELVETSQPAVETQSTVQTAISTTPVAGNATTQAPTQGMLYYFRSDNCPYCIEMDAEIGILKQKGFFNDFGAAVFNIKDNEVSQKYEIRAVPTLILYKDKCSFRKEGFMKSDDIIKWAYQAKCEEQTILVCRDSCPLDEKCYPFGYRKEGKYCSDDGAFKDQLTENSACENNFECSTNVCVDGKCISSNLIQMIIDFFRNLFGMK